MFRILVTTHRYSRQNRVLYNMNQQPQQRIKHVISTLRRYFPLLIVPAVAGLVLATIYAFFLMPEMWTARQSFLIRDDLSGTAFKPGQFDSEESRKSAQETILEVARRPLVVRNVLEKLGPKSSFAGSNWITDEIIEKTQGVIDISAPNGAEFGKTDAIVLTAKDSTRERTRKFIELLSAEIMVQTNRIRSMRFESMESELYQTYQSAEQARDDAIDRLDKLDRRLGSDFGFLSLQGNNNFQQQPTGVEGIKSEILRKQDELERAEAVHAALLKAFNDPAAATQLPSEVLLAQPALQDAMSKMLDLREELHVAKGLYTNIHPKVKGIAEAIEFSQQQIYDSLTGEMTGVQEGIALKKRQLSRLNNRIEELKARLIRLSKSRSEHMALSTQVQQLGAAANLAKTAWSETKSRAVAARTVGLITPTDVAQVNSRPDGLGKRYVALAGLVGGLLVGVGLVLLVMDPIPNNDQGSSASLQPIRQTSPSKTPPFRDSSVAANLASTGTFQHAASAMQSAADAMQMAATSESAALPLVPTPRQTEPATRPHPVQNRPAEQPRAEVDNQATPQPKVNAPNPVADDAMRMALQNQSSTALPRDARAQPVTGQAKTANQQTKSKTNNPFLANDQAPTKVATPPAKAKTVPATAANVRPVDLAKSAAVDNEFVRVSTDDEVVTSTTDLPKDQRTQTDSSPDINQPTQQRTKVSTTVLGDELKPTDPQQPSPQRQPTGTEPFVVSASGETPQPSQDVIDAIPEQIRKLSDSILKFGKNKK